MKLKKEYIEMLKKSGYSDSDIKQIEEATGKTTYTLFEIHRNSVTGKEFYIKIGKVSTKKAIEILGIDTYLSGIGRSAFHWTCSRTNDDETKEIAFDSSKLFY